MSKRFLLFLMAVLTCTIMVAGCGGSDGSDGADGASVDSSVLTDLQNQVAELTDLVNPPTLDTLVERATTAGVDSDALTAIVDGSADSADLQAALEEVATTDSVDDVAAAIAAVDATASAGKSVETLTAVFTTLKTNSATLWASFKAVFAGISADGFKAVKAIAVKAENAGYDTQVANLSADSVTALANVSGETCALCHNGSTAKDGDAHQAPYNDYADRDHDADGVLYAAALAGPVTKAGAVVTIPFTVTVDGVALTNTTQLDQFTSKSFYAIGYEDGSAYSSVATVSYVTDVTDVTGHFEAVLNTAVDKNGDAVTTLSAGNLSTATDVIGAVVLRKDKISPADKAGGYLQAYDVVIGAGGSVGVDVATYVSTANAAGCEKCHGTPYMKHANYILDVVDGKDFLLCRACHKAGQKSHATQGFQQLYDDPEAYAAGEAYDATKYDTDRELMLDVHMSHNMEFAYPQSMRNCATCHDGKLDLIITDANFTFKTCRSCHAVDKLVEKFPTNEDGTTVSWHNFSDLNTQNCNDCHKAGGVAPAFSEIHTGYDPVIYTATGQKYADEVVVTIDSVSLAEKALTINFSATSGITGVDAATIVPTVYVAGYGYNTKDFIVSNHDRDANGERVGEFTFGSTNGNFSGATTDGASWSVVFDVNALDADKYVTNGIVKNLEVAIAPSLTVDGVTVGLNAPSKTVSLTTGAFVDNYYEGTAAIVEVEEQTVAADGAVKGCNTCHDQLATTFHGPNRGGNIVVCRMCHTTMSGGSHLEMQSRSIDSYVHAIHSFQPFDPGDIDFSDAVEAMEYEHHINSTYPNFTITNCESCHNSGTYNVPDPSKSLPGKLSAADTFSEERNIGAQPAVVTGASSRACGSCHRSEAINADDAGALATVNSHIKANGFMLTDDGDLLKSVIKALFN